VYDSYGRKCNSRFFVNYGFSLSNNEDNQCRIYLKIPKSDRHYLMKERFLGNRPRRFQIPMDYKDKSTRPCLAFLRLVHAQDCEVESLASSYGTNIRDIKPISIENEIAVLCHLRSACQTALEDFPTTLEDDNNLLNNDQLSFNTRNAILMRRGEKEVLHHWITLTDQANICYGRSWSEIEQIVQTNQLFSNKYASLYYKNVLIPLFKKKEITYKIE